MTTMLASRLVAPALWLLVGVSSSAAAAQSAMPSSGQTFTCVNAAGRTLTSDRLIGECMDREQRVLSREGALIGIVPPSLTADERAEKEARDRRLAEMPARAFGQQRIARQDIDAGREAWGGLAVLADALVADANADHLPRIAKEKRIGGEARIDFYALRLGLLAQPAAQGAERNHITAG